MWNEGIEYDVGDLIFIRLINGQIWEILNKKKSGIYNLKSDNYNKTIIYTVQSIYTEEIRSVHRDDVMLVCKAENAEGQKKSFVKRKKLFEPVTLKATFKGEEVETMEDKTLTVSKEVNDMLDQISYDKGLDSLLIELDELVKKRDSTKNNKTVIKKIEVVKRKLEKLTKNISDNKESERVES